MRRQAVLLIAVMMAALFLAGGTALALDKMCPSSDVCGGTSGNDLLIGTDAGNILSPSAGNDQLIGNGGDDILNGGPGSDTYTFSDGFGANDTIEDTAGSSKDRETIDFSKVSSGMTIAAVPENPNIASGASAGTHIVRFTSGTTLENIIGSAGSDGIRGGQQINRYDLRAGGNDNITDDGGIPPSGISNDTYTGYKSGFVSIFDRGGSGDILDLRPHKVTDISIKRDSNNLVFLMGPSSNDLIRIQDYFLNGSKIEKIVFANRTITSISLS
jgi:hypothetical protein